MFLIFGFLCLCFCCLRGVFGDEVKSVSVMEGHSVTLHTHLTHIHTDDLILWKFGPQGTVIAKITINKTSINADVHDGMFRDRLQVDDQTGSLTITDITTQHSGLYHMTISGQQKTSYTFSVTVYEASLTVVICCVVGALLIVTALLIFYIWRKHTNTQQEAVQSGEEEITYSDPTFHKRQTHQARAEVEDEVMYASVNKRR
ncbi:uncharacterized protein LOC130548441 [Triplophysa rosa]|uniref:uncharacterized protein LOC130548441 n=1 Tax=Triplophysa rosa TaxID=992332 RepID=UPI00254623FE|nr:uncharacterized protein LOC130548441 [Triplophysa rosa]